MITVVTGLGRCGSSMTMGMLYAGGAPMSMRVKAPLFEMAGTKQNSYDWQYREEDLVIKVLHPCNHLWAPDLEFRWIWLSRDHKQQSKSMVKLAVTMDKGLRDFSIKKATADSLAIIEKRGEQLLKLRFEFILKHPHHWAQRLADYLPDLDLDVDKMAEVVDTKRSPKCLPTMVELER